MYPAIYGKFDDKTIEPLMAALKLK